MRKPEVIIFNFNDFSGLGREIVEGKVELVTEILKRVARGAWRGDLLTAFADLDFARGRGNKNGVGEAAENALYALRQIGDSFGARVDCFDGGIDTSDLIKIAAAVNYMRSFTP